MKRYITMTKEEAMTPFKSITSTLNDKGEMVAFETSHLERQFDGYLEPLLSVRTKKEAERRVQEARKKGDTRDWIVREMNLTETGTERLNELFEWLDEEYNGTLIDALDTPFVLAM